ncbi:MAG: hypothetical protein ABFS35_21015, partial [Bacteroidota bacterium]
MLKAIHLLPAMLISGLFILLLLTLLFPVIFAPLWLLVALGFILICLIAFFQSYKMYKSLKIGFLSIMALNIQVFGYGYGLLKGIWKFHILNTEIENK